MSADSDYGSGVPQPACPPWFRLLALVTAFLLASSLRAVVSEDTLPAAEWVSADAGNQAGTVFLRRTFAAEPGLVKAVLLAAADQRVTLFLNGTNVGIASGFQKAVTLDVTRWLRPGANVLAAQVENPTGPATCRLMLELAQADGRQRWLVTDSSWRASRGETAGWNSPLFPATGWTPAFAHGAAGLQRWGNPFAVTKSTDAYNSWMLARGADQATDPATFTVRPGFQVELLRSAQPGEDSWITLAFDPQGRITLAREKRGLLRLTLADRRVTQVEVIDDTLNECRGLLYAYDSLYVNANNSRGFYRLRDTDGDGKFDEQKLLLTTEGGVGHGRNQLRLGPDGYIYLVHGDDVVFSKFLAADSPVQQLAGDQLMATQDPRKPLSVSRFMQVGHIVQTDQDGSFFRLFAGGLRNPMDLAFNEDGEAFTYESDMERDLGTPWYRPTRVLHLVPGGDYGWRRGAGNIPPSAPDTLPAVVDIGVGSPTGVAFGSGSNFPEPYRHAFFIGDWAYGRILVVFLKPNGATYAGTSEEFLSGRPLNVTDLTFGPDGALYFVTGGRGTRSGLYRVSWAGKTVDATSATVTDAGAAAARAIRRRLETNAPVLGDIWPHLGASDRWIRSAARLALERVPLGEWSARALSETNPTVAANALLGFSRVVDGSGQAPLFNRLVQLPLGQMSEADQLAVLRTYGIMVTRFGWPGDAVATTIARQLAPLYPARSPDLDRELSRLLVHLRAPEALPRTLPLLTAATTTDDRLYYLIQLWALRDGWNLAGRRAYFEALRLAEQQPGARDYYSTLGLIRRSLTNSMGSAERLALGDLVTAAATKSTETVAPAGPVVKAWSLADFDFAGDAARSGSVDRGRDLFRSAGCVTCHRAGTEGGVVGPDLTAVAARFGPRDLLDQILNPSKAVDEKYRQTVLTLTDGSTLTGLLDRDADPLVLLPPEPGAVPVEVPRNRVRDRHTSDISPMPGGLLDSLNREQVFDLLVFLNSAGSGVK